MYGPSFELEQKQPSDPSLSRVSQSAGLPGMDNFPVNHMYNSNNLPPNTDRSSHAQTHRQPVAHASNGSHPGPPYRAHVYTAPARQRQSAPPPPSSKYSEPQPQQRSDRVMEEGWVPSGDSRGHPHQHDPRGLAGGGQDSPHLEQHFPLALEQQTDASLDSALTRNQIPEIPNIPTGLLDSQTNSSNNSSNNPSNNLKSESVEIEVGVQGPLSSDPNHSRQPELPAEQEQGAERRPETSPPQQPQQFPAQWPWYKSTSNANLHDPNNPQMVYQRYSAADTAPVRPLGIRMQPGGVPLWKRDLRAAELRKQRSQQERELGLGTWHWESKGVIVNAKGRQKPHKYVIPLPRVTFMTCP